MRFILGLILGVILTIGTAYISDAMQAPATSEAANTNRMVNWVVVNDRLNGMSNGVQAAWARLVSGTKDLDRQVEHSKS